MNDAVTACLLITIFIVIGRLSYGKSFWTVDGWL